MRLCEEKVKSGEVRGKSGKIGSDLLFANVRIRFAIRTYDPIMFLIYQTYYFF